MDDPRSWVVPSVMAAVLALLAGLMVFSFRIQESTASGPQFFEVSLTELAVTPTNIEAEAGRPITIEVTNDGAVEHNYVVSGVGGTPMLGSGESATLELGVLDPGTYAVLCAVAGHADGGMKGTITVKGDGGGSSASMAMDPDEMDRLYMAGVEAFPAATEGQGGQRIQPRMDNGVNVFELTAEETRWEVEPGVFKDAMAYNGQVPGPEIRVRLGERVRIVLHNKLHESTAIHFHGLDVPNSQDGVPGLTQPLVKAGESFTYEFDVPNAGSHMYHSHMNGAHQIPAGLLGAFVVEGPNEPSVDVDHVMVLNDGPLGYTLNGKGFPATQPIVASPGQTVRIRYMNEGLQGHPMHLHGMAQQVITKDGHPLPVPYMADTIWVAPGERYDVLVTAREGAWALHCHILSHAEGAEGMFGMVTAMVVQ